MGTAITAMSKTWKCHVAEPGSVTCQHKQESMIRSTCCVHVLDLPGINDNRATFIKFFAEIKESGIVFLSKFPK